MEFKLYIKLKEFVVPECYMIRISFAVQCSISPRALELDCYNDGMMTGHHLHKSLNNHSMRSILPMRRLQRWVGDQRERIAPDNTTKHNESRDLSFNISCVILTPLFILLPLQLVPSAAGMLFVTHRPLLLRHHSSRHTSCE